MASVKVTAAPGPGQRPALFNPGDTRASAVGRKCERQGLADCRRYLTISEWQLLVRGADRCG